MKQSSLKQIKFTFPISFKSAPLVLLTSFVKVDMISGVGLGRVDSTGLC